MDDSAADLDAIAGCFALPAAVTAISPLGNGNVNDTYRVDTANGDRFVLQRLNTQVFSEPELVMGNLQLLSDHAQRRSTGVGDGPGAERWEVPRVIGNRHSGDPWVRIGQEFWRLISYVDHAVTVDAIQCPDQAYQVGRGLGLFHSLISTLPADQLADTLPGFHITPSYLEAYDRTLDDTDIQLCEGGRWCRAFVEQRRQLAPVLETAKADGLLRLRPIHGDPKVNNVMLCANTGVAVSLVDLDTVKPGLVHYDIGDCLRSACNRLGEETCDPDSIHFDLDLCRAVLEGYVGAARDSLSDADLDHIYEATRLISFELGLRFFSDHLAGDVYFRTQRPGHNLDRALVQFKLTESIEAQEQEIRAIVEELR